MKSFNFFLLISTLLCLLLLPSKGRCQDPKAYGLSVGVASTSLSGSSSQGFTGGLSGFMFSLEDPGNLVGLINYTSTDIYECFGLDGDLWIFFHETPRLLALIGINVQAAKIKGEDAGDWRYGFNIGAGWLFTTWSGLEIKYSRVEKVNLIKVQLQVFTSAE